MADSHLSCLETQSTYLHISLSQWFTLSSDLIELFQPGTNILGFVKVIIVQFILAVIRLHLMKL